MTGDYYHTTFKREYEAKFSLNLGLWVVKKEWKEIKKDIYAKYPYLKRRKDTRFCRMMSARVYGVTNKILKQWK